MNDDIKKVFGVGKKSSKESTNSLIPQTYQLYQNYPNPFNPRTVISFQLSVVSTISIKVYDINGREVQTLVSGRMQAGTYEAVWDGTGFPSGVYFCRMVTEGYGKTIKMTLVK